MKSNPLNKKKWRSCILLASQLSEIETFCKNSTSKFANPTQFIGFAVRKELDLRKGGHV
jgi:hypothetical protein